MQKCILCAIPLNEDDSYCPRCGEYQNREQSNRLQIGGIKLTGCIKCGYLHEQEDAFCKKCGWYVKDTYYKDDGLTLSATMGSQHFCMIPDLPRYVTDITEYWEYFLLLMRRLDSKTVVDLCTNIVERTFSVQMTGERIDQTMVLSTDNLCKAVAWATFINVTVEKYFSEAVYPLFARLASLNTRIIYILDNEFSEERLMAARFILGACDMAIVHPTKGQHIKSVDDVLREIKQNIDAKKNIVFIQSDTRGNYLENVLAETSAIEGYVQAIRHEALSFKSNPQYIKRA